jgi:hypothetical protein
LLVQAVDEGLGWLGEGPKNTIYELLETNYQMPKQEIPTRFVEFAKLLREQMGPAVDPLLEFVIEGFYLKLNIEPPKWTDLNDGVQAIGQILHENSINQIDLSGNSLLYAEGLKRKVSAST